MHACTTDFMFSIMQTVYRVPISDSQKQKIQGLIKSLQYQQYKVSCDKLYPSIAPFPGSSVPEWEIEFIHACLFRVPESLGTRLTQVCHLVMDIFIPRLPTILWGMRLIMDHTLALLWLLHARPPTFKWTDYIFELSTIEICNMPLSKSTRVLCCVGLECKFVAPLWFMSLFVEYHCTNLNPHSSWYLSMIWTWLW